MTAFETNRLSSNPRCDSNSLALSRRGFVELGTASVLTFMGASLSFLPPSSDGKGILTPTYAYGDDPQFTVSVLSPSQVGVFVADITTGTPQPLSNATVTIVSRYPNAKKQSITCTTDANGKAIIDIADLSEDNNGQKGKNVFEFNATVKVSCQGYRLFETARIRVRGAQGLEVATQKLEEGAFYPSLISLDDIDAAYTDCTFVRSSLNNVDHTITLTLRNANLNKCSCALLMDTDTKNGVKLGSTTLTSNSEGVATTKFTGKYLQVGSTECIQEKAKVYFTVDVLSSTSADPAKFTIPTKITAKTAPADAEYNNKAVNFTPPFGFSSLDCSEIGTIRIPFFDDHPMKFQFLPDFIPVRLCFDPTGYGSITIHSPSWTPLSDDGTFNASSWKTYSIKAMDESYAKAFEGYQKSFDRIKDARSQMKTDNSNFMALDVLPGVSMDLGVQVLFAFSSYKEIDSLLEAPTSERGDGNLSLQSNSDPFLGEFRVALQFSLGLTLTSQFLILAFPTFLQLMFGLTSFASFAYDCSILKLPTAEGGLSPDNATFIEKKDKTFPIGLTISLRVALGVGFPGAASISVSGGGYIDLSMTFTTQPTKEHPNPHLVAGFGLSVEVMAQYLCFKFSGVIWHYDKPYLGSNWADDKKSTQENSLPAWRYCLNAKGKDGIEHSFDLSDGSLDPYGAFGLGGPQALTLLNDVAEILTANTFKHSAEITARRATQNDSMAGTASGWIYEPASGHGSTGEVIPHAGVEGIGYGAVKPTSDTLVFDAVFSDPKHKIVSHTVNGVEQLVLFRIVTVEYPNNVFRTRLAWSTYEGEAWSDATAIDFSFESTYGHGFKREDMYDYEFDVINMVDDELLPDGGFLVLISGGLRPNNDSTSINDILVNPAMVALLLDANMSVDPLSIVDLLGETSWGRSNQYHMVHLPCLVSGLDQDPNHKYALGAGALVHRSSDNKEDILSEKAQVEVLLLDAFWDQAFGLNASIHTYDYQIDPKTQDIQCMAIQNGADDTTNHHDIAISVFYSQKASLPATGSSEMALIDVFVTRDLLNNSPLSVNRAVKGALAFSNAQPWSGHGGYLFAKNKHLYGATFDYNAVDVASFTESQLDIDGFDATNFTVSADGTYLYLAQNFDGIGGYDYSKDADPQPKRSSEHIILASKLLKDANSGAEYFCSPFPFASIDHPIDLTAEIVSASNAASFMAAEIYDAANSVARMHHITVPHTLSLSVANACSTDPFVVAGAGTDKKPLASFDVTLDNTGNIAVTGFTLELRDEKNTVISTYEVDLASVKLQPTMRDLNLSNNSVKDLNTCTESNWVDGASAEYNLGVALGSGCLAPGKPATVQAYFAIPKTWSGEKKVSVHISTSAVTCSDGTRLTLSASEGTLAAVIDSQPSANLQAADNSKPRIVDPVADLLQSPANSTPTVHTLHVHKETSVTVSDSIAADFSGFSPNNITRSGGAGGEGTAGTSTDAKQSAATDDNVGGLSLVGGVAALAAGGLLAYSRRRTELESSEG